MTLVNLECVLKDDASNMTKNKQYIFRGATSYAQALVDASIEQVNLANNHVIDYQSAGEASTREALAAAALRDKKNHGGRLDLILPESVGRCRIQPIPPEEFGDWLTDGGVV